MYTDFRKGISLIVLTITIVVLIILAGATILTISNANLINKSSETAFRTNISNYLEEYNTWLSVEKMKHRGNVDVLKINASKNVAYNGNYIQDIIKNIKNEDIENYEIIAGNLTYTGYGVTDENERNKQAEIAEQVGLKLVSSALGDEDTIVFANTTKSSGYDNIKIYGNAENGVEGISEITLTVTQNLINNGFGEYKDNSNFASAIINLPDEKIKGGVSSFYTESKRNSIDKTISTSNIKIDSNKKYVISMYIKPNSADLKIYSGIVEYDIDKNKIVASDIMSVSNTLTYLTKDLKNGDTVVYLNDLSNFENSESTSTSKLGFIFWNYKDSTGYQYEPLTYSKNRWHNIYTYDNIDKVNNTITLKSAWQNGTFFAGTKLSQSMSSSTYNYALCAANVNTTEWEHREKIISGKTIGANSNNLFRYPTRYIDWFIIPNYDSLVGGGVNVANIIFAESDKYNRVYTIDMTGHEPLRTMEDGTSDYIDFKTKKIVRNVGINNGTMYKLSSVTYENILLPDIPIYEGNTAITLNQIGRLEGTYIK